MVPGLLYDRLDEVDLEGAIDVKVYVLFDHLSRRQLEGLVAEAADVGARLVVLPEAFVPAYPASPVFGPVFGGFSAEAIRDRILDAGAKVVVTANEGLRGGKGMTGALAN